MLRLFNTLTRKKEPVKGPVKLYFCGPTVYDYAHIGNFRSYVFADVLRRYLELAGHRVKLVMNLTDVDDKTIKGAQKENIPLKEFTQRYEKAFFEDIAQLRIKPASVYPRATEHIVEMADIINRLLKKGLAYVSQDGVYFDISAFRRYGKLAKLKQSELKGARLRRDEYTKDEMQDFALWKAWSPDDGSVSWDVSFSGQTMKGRPGWHIECSAMARKHLGTVDMHGGGVDLIFPHHENEIAQSEGAFAKQFARHWIHCEHLLVDGKKMSKSLGNFHTLRGLLDKGYDQLAIRYLLLNAHYRSQLNFTFAELEAAQRTVENINDFFSRAADLAEKSSAKTSKKIPALVKKAETAFSRAMDDDLNVPAALSTLFALMEGVYKEIDDGAADRKSMKAVLSFMQRVNSILDVVYQNAALTRKEKELIEKREQLRKAKKFVEADRIRAALQQRGVALEDTPQGVRWKKYKK